jgi:hypothetical protein
VLVDDIGDAVEGEVDEEGWEAQPTAKSNITIRFMTVRSCALMVLNTCILRVIFSVYGSACTVAFTFLL